VSTQQLAGYRERSAAALVDQQQFLLDPESSHVASMRRGFSDITRLTMCTNR
jgi:hypothetical protein